MMLIEQRDIFRNLWDTNYAKKSGKSVRSSCFFGFSGEAPYLRSAYTLPSSAITFKFYPPSEKQLATPT